MTSIDTHQQQQQKNQQQHTVQSSLSTLPPPLLVPRKRGRKKREENIDALNEEEGSSTQVANSQKIQKPLNRLHGGGDGIPLASSDSGISESNVVEDPCTVITSMTGNTSTTMTAASSSNDGSPRR
uniref:Candidate secreted effector n=1 Tax=Meloidogyne incognita TaxID=6306 RepID=A0A914P1F4_MELIC